MIRSFGVRFAVVVCLLAGCSSSGQPVLQSSPPPPDTLIAKNARLQAENRALRDSLNFHDDIETGQYYRDLRVLQDRLTRLTYEVRLLRNGGLTVAVIPADSLFVSLDSVSAPGVDRLERVASQLNSAYPNRTVRVEGHSDDRPLGGSFKEQFPSNWELSAARASAVLRTLLDLSDLDRSQFVALGYGATRPRASNDTPAGRALNRRVRISVLPTPRNYSRPFETSW